MLGLWCIWWIHEAKFSYDSLRQSCRFLKAQMSVFNDNEISNILFTLLGRYHGLLESLKAAEPGAQGEEESSRHFSLWWMNRLWGTLTNLNKIFYGAVLFDYSALHCCLIAKLQNKQRYLLFFISPLCSLTWVQDDISGFFSSSWAVVLHKCRGIVLIHFSWNISYPYRVSRGAGTGNWSGQVHITSGSMDRSFFGLKKKNQWRVPIFSMLWDWVCKKWLIL